MCAEKSLIGKIGNTFYVLMKIINVLIVNKEILTHVKLNTYGRTNTQTTFDIKIN